MAKHQADGSSPLTTHTIPNSDTDVKRHSVTTTSISDVAAEDPTAFDLGGMRYSISTEDEVADKIRA